MLGPAGQTAVKAVLADLAAGLRVPPVHIHTLLGVEASELRSLAAAYPNLRSISLEIAELAIHNALNLYVNGIELSEEQWKSIGTSLAAVESAFSEWK